MEPLTIIKIGGNLLNHKSTLQGVLNSFSKINTAKILVHGGGKSTSELCKRLGIKPKIYKGRRITDQATLEVATMVYAGLINKKVVSCLQKNDCNAIGFSGADGDLIRAQKRPSQEIDYGFAGDVKKVNSKLLIGFLEQGIVPVFCAITHNKKGQLLNTNADTIASVLASELSNNFQVSLKFCFEKEGVLANPLEETSVLAVLSKKDYLLHQKKGSISEGMIPKLDNAFYAKKAKVDKVMICGTNGILKQKGTEICL